MSNPFVSRVGGILSADIAVPEHDAEVRFYASVLCTGAAPLWREDLMNNQGTPVIGLGVRGPEYADLPLQWMPHIQVADVAASAKRAVALGGVELMHGRADDGSSQWAVLSDPDGAAFGVIPVVPPEMIPATADQPDDTTRVGHIAGFDLTVSDAGRARDFYTAVIGWSVHDVQMTDGSERYVDYGMAGSDGGPAAGIRHARGVNQGLPPVWLMVLPVGDLAESLRRVRDGGGKVAEERQGPDGKVGFAVVQDPVGVWLALMPG